MQIPPAAWSGFGTVLHLPPCTRRNSNIITQSIDLIVSKSSSPGRVRKEIVGHPMSPLVEKSGAVYYRHTSGWEMEVKLIPDWLCPYLPAAARPVRDDSEALPYVSLEDLIVFKVDACGLHERVTSKQREADDAAALLDLASKHTPLKLNDDKMDRIEQALSDLVQFSTPDHDKSWWQRSLGKIPDNQRSAQDILSELSDHTFSSPALPNSPSNHSSISRSSSYMSAASAHSSCSSISSIASPDEKPTARPRKMSLTGKPPKHKRHPSTGGVVPKTTLAAAMQRLDLERPASPGMAFTNRI